MTHHAIHSPSKAALTMKETITLDSKTYSLAQLWNLNAKALNASVAEGLTDAVPVSGDAHQRQANRWLLTKAEFAGLMEPTC